MAAYLVLVLAFAIGAFGQVDVRLLRTNGTRRVCLADNKPLAFCEGLDPGNFTGYTVELFNRIWDFISIGDSGYYFDCLPTWTAMLDDIRDPTGTCYIGLGGIDVTAEAFSEGVQYSWPIYKEGLRVMIHSYKKSDMWSIFGPFDLGVWLALLGTSFLVGILVWVYEEGADYIKVLAERKVKAKRAAARGNTRGLTGGYRRRGSRDGKGEEEEEEEERHESGESHSFEGLNAFVEAVHGGLKTEGLNDTTWGAVGKLVGVADMGPSTLAARMLVYAYGFMVLIMVALYTASVAADITTTSLSSSIGGFDDLPGLRVATYKGYVDDLANMSITATGYTWDNTEDDQRFLDMLLNNEVDALVLDDTWVRYQDSQYCSLFAVGERKETRNLAFAFPADIPKAVVEVFNEALLQLQRTEMIMDEVATKQINLQSSCPTADPDGNFKVEFEMVAGLWVIMAIATAAACVVVFLPLLMARLSNWARGGSVAPEPVKPREQAAEGQQPAPAASSGGPKSP